MFDIGFTELLLVAIAGLLVIGPKQLPETIRTISLWVGRAKRTIADFKADLEEEIGIDEIRSQLRKESILGDFEKDKQELQALGDSIKKTNIDLLDSFNYLEEKSEEKIKDSNSREQPGDNP